MALPLVLISFAILAAAAVAYGTHPGWAEFRHGFHFILWSHRLQWPLVAASLLSCVALIGLVISGRRRAWWLTGLGPVLALLFHRFQPDRPDAFAVLDSPSFAEASDATFLADDDWVVGLTFGDAEYAYPYAALFRSPVVLQTDHDRHLVLVWSPYANRVMAFGAAPELKGRDLEVVSMPANATLVYNGRVGQFVNGITGLTPDGGKPAGFRAPVATHKTTWKQWRAAHPTGKVMRPAQVQSTRRAAPGRPILPAFSASGLPAAVSGKGTPAPRRMRVAVVGMTRPAAVESATLGEAPVNLEADGEPVFVFRPGPGEPVRAFRRVFGDNVRSAFEPKRDPKRPDVMFKDVATGTLWTAGGVAVAGNARTKGKRLSAVPVDEDVDWAVLKYWYPELQLHREEEKPSPVLEPPTSRPAPAGPPATRRSRPRSKASAR